MAEITAASTDGYVLSTDNSDWDGARSATTGSSNGDTATRAQNGIYAAQLAARSGSNWQIYRSFFAFDTSGVTATVSSATLKIYGYTNGGADIIVLKATKPDLSTGIANADFDALYPTAGCLTALGNSDGSGTGTLNGIAITYSAQLSTWSTSGYNDITLNATARSDMVSLGVLAVCIVEYDHDFIDIDPGADGNSYSSGVYYQEYSGTGTDPKIDYTLAGYGHTVSGVASANISKVKGVATASIDKVIGVD